MLIVKLKPIEISFETILLGQTQNVCRKYPLSYVIIFMTNIDRPA